MPWGSRINDRRRTGGPTRSARARVSIPFEGRGTYRHVCTLHRTDLDREVIVT